MKCAIIKEEYRRKGDKMTCVITWKNPLTRVNQKSKGSSNCNPNDEWNDSIGMKLAHSRATMNLITSYLKSVDAFAESLIRYNDIYENEIDFQNKLIHNEL